MRSNILFIRIFSVLTTAILLVGMSFGQGKGHGGGKDKGERGNRGGSQGQEKHRGGNPDGNKGERRGGGNPWGGQEKVKKERVERGGWQGQQKHAQKAERQQSQQWQQVQRQQNQHQRDAVRQQDRQRDALRQQDRHQRDVMQQQMQQQRQWQNAQREQRRVYEQPKQNWGQIRREQAFEAKRERDSLKSQRRSVRDTEKYAKKQQHFDDKAFRKAGRRYRQTAPYAYEQRDQWLNNSLYQPRYRDYRTSEPTYRDYRTYEPAYQDYRSYEPAYQPYNEPGYRVYDYSPNYGYNGDDGYYSSGRSSWVEPLIRSLIASFFSNGIGGGYYDDYADSQPYDRNDYGYAPQYSQTSYNTFGYPPTYAYYEPATYYGYDEYANNGIPYDAFQGVLPYNDVRDIYSGGLAGELIQRALGTGYYQGLLEGQQAQQRGWGDRYYSDPYLYEQAIYDPYSTSIGDNRRYFSEGYEMGYNDALRQRDEFDLAGGGEVDLVSLLLGSVLSLRG